MAARIGWQFPRTFTAGGTIAVNALVKLSGANVVVNDVAGTPIGVLLEGASAGGGAVSGARCTVGLFFPTVKMIASNAITAGAKVYGDAAGKVDDNAPAGSPIFVGIALEAAAADGDTIECLPFFP